VKITPPVLLELRTTSNPCVECLASEFCRPYDALQAGKGSGAFQDQGESLLWSFFGLALLAMAGWIHLLSTSLFRVRTLVLLLSCSVTVLVAPPAQKIFSE
jgi:hypothetical protein